MLNFLFLIILLLLLHSNCKKDKIISTLQNDLIDSKADNQTYKDILKSMEN